MFRALVATIVFLAATHSQAASVTLTDFSSSQSRYFAIPDQPLVGNSFDLPLDDFTLRGGGLIYDTLSFRVTAPEGFLLQRLAYDQSGSWGEGGYFPYQPDSVYFIALATEISVGGLPKSAPPVTFPRDFYGRPLPFVAPETEFSFASSANMSSALVTITTFMGFSSYYGDPRFAAYVALTGARLTVDVAPAPVPLPQTALLLGAAMALMSVFALGRDPKILGANSTERLLV